MDKSQLTAVKYVIAGKPPDRGDKMMSVEHQPTRWRVFAVMVRNSTNSVFILDNASKLLADFLSHSPISKLV